MKTKVERYRCLINASSCINQLPSKSVFEQWICLSQYIQIKFRCSWIKMFNVKWLFGYYKHQIAKCHDNWTPHINSNIYIRRRRLFVSHQVKSQRREYLVQMQSFKFISIKVYDRVKQLHFCQAFILFQFLSISFFLFLFLSQWI